MQPLFSMTLLRKFGGLALANWPIKLMALVLAVVLWAVVTAQETTTESVPVTLIVQPPEGRSVIGELPAIRARYRGTPGELDKLLPNPPVILKEVPATTGNTRVIRLSPDDLGSVEGADVMALEVAPDSIVVFLDDMVRKPVPVASRVNFLPDSGHEVFGTVRVMPATVTIQGPEALVAHVTSVSTTPIRRSGLTEPVEYTVQIDTAGLGLVTVEPATVRVMADIGAVATHVLIGVEIRVESPSGGPWQSVPSTVYVTVSGRAGRVRRFTRDSVRVIARPSGTMDEERVAVEVLPPRGVTGTATPDSVLIRRSDGG